MKHAPLNEVFNSAKYPELILEHVVYTMSGTKAVDPWFYGFLKSDPDFVIVGNTVKDTERKYKVHLDRQAKRKTLTNE